MSKPLKQVIQFDEKLDEILKPLIGHDDGVEFGNGYHDECLEELTEAKQAIKQLIASELGTIIDANVNEDGSVDSYRVYEVLMEWMGELQGGGDE